MEGHRPMLISLATVGGLLVGLFSVPVRAQHPGQGGQQAIFTTKAEAEAAAKAFHCKGAHKMGNKWMPCDSHGEVPGGHSGPPAH
jgi:hypothetical protein